MEDAEIRLLVLDILVSIIDRHDNRHKFSPVRFGHTDQLKTLGIYNVPLKKLPNYHALKYVMTQNILLL